MITRCDVTAVILAGGRARRLGGIAKHMLVVEGRTIFARQVEVLAPRVATIIVSAAEDVPGYRTVHDAMPGVGPLAGIAAALHAATTAWLLVVAGDMPYVTGAVVELLLEQAGPRCDAVGIRIGDLPEPLLCVLRREAATAVVDARLAGGRFKASELLAGLRTSWIQEHALRQVDADLHVLRNINTPEDLPAS